MTSRALTAALRLVSLTAACASAAPVLAAPTPISNAVFAGVYVRDCRTAGNASTTPDKCENSPHSDRFDNTFVDVRESLLLGAVNTSVASSHPIATHPTLGNSRSLIDASGAAGSLLLKQGVFSETFARVSGHSVGLQSFQFTGTTGEMRTIENVLDFEASVAPRDLGQPASGNWADPATYLRTRVTVFSLPTAAFEYDPVYLLEIQNRGFKEQASRSTGYKLEAEVNKTGFAVQNGDVTRLTFAMEQGRFYFIDSYLGLWARFGAYVDATHTFTSTVGQLNDNNEFVRSTEGLTFAQPFDVPVAARVGTQPLPPAPATVPEPGTLAAAALGLLMLGAVRRRRR